MPASRKREPSSDASSAASSRQRSPSLGERAAVLGYSAQYLVAAELIHEALLGGRLEWIALADPEAGRVDDFQIAKPGRLDAFQIKWHDYPGSFTYAQLRGSRAGSSGETGLLSQLADGWRRLRGVRADREVFVHLVTNSYASTRAKPPVDRSLADGPTHFAAFVRDGWAKIEKDRDGDRPKLWAPALEELRQAIDLSPAEFTLFRGQCVLQFSHRLAEEEERGGPPGLSARIKDIREIAGFLFHEVGRERGLLRLDRLELLRRLGWQGRFEFRARHEFPVEATYQPIEGTVADLEERLERHRSGYLALLGTPGSGKSTLLTDRLRYRPGFRVVRYYCFVPDDTRLARGEAWNFLHDLSLALLREGVHPQGMSIGRTLEELRDGLEAQLAELATRWREKGERTLILVDGLDHVEREQRPERSLVAELPAPAAVPEGVLVILGSQKLQLQDLHPRIVKQLENEDRIVRMQQLTRRAIRDVIAAFGLRVQTDEQQLQRIEELSTGHPLALMYLLNRLREAESEESLEQALGATPPYTGHIEGDYASYWNQVANDKQVRDLLALLSRVRGPLDMRFAVELVDEPAVERLVATAGYFFDRLSTSIWRFFHNSFRQFVLDQTGRGPFGEEDKRKHRNFHRRLANFAARPGAPGAFAWEQVYHRFCTGDYDEVLRLGTQARFRNQFLDLRPVTDIRDDIALVMRAARERRDRLAVVRMLLIDEEISERAYALEQVDVPGLLLDLGKVEAAVAAVMHDRELQVDKAVALDFATQLAVRGHRKQARAVFEAAEPLELINAPDGVELQDDMAVRLLESWVGAAPTFRPLEEVLDVIGKLKVSRGDHPQQYDPKHALGELRLRLLVAFADALVDAGGRGAAERLQASLCGWPEEHIIRRRMAAEDCSKHPGTEWAAQALDRLCQVN